jgi:putative Mg2+ transporter-C (MgtC) family protein
VNRLARRLSSGGRRLVGEGGTPVAIALQSIDMIGHAEMIMRIGAGALLGGVIGYERDVHRRPVGLRTHLIVSMAAATFMVLSSQFVYWQHYGKDDLVGVDASRIASSVVSGIGFLAGGAILRTGVTVQGLTTAAALWLVTAIGMCAGAGMYVESAIVTGFGIIALTVFRRFEDKNVQRRRVAVSLGAGAGGVEPVLDSIRKLGATAVEVEYERHLDDDKRKILIVIDIHVSEKVPLPTVIAAIESVPGVRRVHVQHHI